MKIYNSMSRRKEEFVPVQPNKVRMYVCGPTVYHYFHIGNARPFMVFDAFRKYLEYRGYEVTYVQNFTDVDDKIIKRANEENVESSEISEKYIGEYFKDADALGICRADHHPKVTDYIDDIILYVSELIEKGHAYQVGSDVYFSVDSFSNYGSLSKQSIDDLELGARVEISASKRNPLDFVLWKGKKEGEPFWVSPWGEGRPGWHIECSVMSTALLGETIDIHAGGQDLIFPHHENEIAQSEAKSGKKYVNYWMHNGYINIDNQKMSKSKNNFFTTRDILESFSPEVVRFFMLSAHYRNPINFSRELLESSQVGLERLYNAKSHMEHLMAHCNNGSSEAEEEIVLKLNAFKEKFIQVMDDDFNTADGISTLFDLVRYTNTVLSDQTSQATLERAYELFNELSGVLGIVMKKEEDIGEEVEKLIELRQKARSEKNFSEADRIRDELKAMGVILKDTPQGVKWHKEER